MFSMLNVKKLLEGPNAPARHQLSGEQYIPLMLFATKHFASWLSRDITWLICLPDDPLVLGPYFRPIPCGTAGPHLGLAPQMYARHAVHLGPSDVGADEGVVELGGRDLAAGAAAGAAGPASVCEARDVGGEALAVLSEG